MVFKPHHYLFWFECVDGATRAGGDRLHHPSVGEFLEHVGERSGGVMS